jgi:hypothetical protein
MHNSMELREQSRQFTEAAKRTAGAHAKYMLAGFAQDLAKLAEQMEREETYAKKV